MTIDRVIKKFKENHPKADSDMLQLAYDFAEAAHKGQKRKSGEPYIGHPLHTAYLLAEANCDLATVTAGILHDVPEDTEVSLENVKNNFGEEVYLLVKGITKLGKIKYRGVERYRENIRKMILTMTDDLRILYIKFADRLHNLRTIEALPKNKQKRIATETLEIYAPTAGLLGVWRFKWQMEDICFKYLHPEDYQKIEYKYEIEKKAERNQFFQKVKLQDVSLMTRQLSSLLSANIQLVEALEALIDQIENPKLKNLLSTVKQKVTEGDKLADALRPYKNIF